MVFYNTIWQIWTHLDQFKQVWTCFVQFGQVWTCLYSWVVEKDFWSRACERSLYHESWWWWWWWWSGIISKISSNMMKFENMIRHDQTWSNMYARICPDMPWYARICPDLPGYARICPDMPGNARKCPEMPGYARICPGLKII